MKKHILLLNAKPVCGVADYTNKLGLHLFKQWKWNSVKYKGFSSIVKILFLGSNDLLLFQYPARVYRKNLILPVILYLLSKVRNVRLISVLHEYSEASAARKLLCSIIAKSSSKIIMTNEYEKSRLPPELKAKATVVPIGSNIQVVTKSLEQKKGNIERICYFGLIRPGKGLESFVSLCQKLRTLENVQPVLIGSEVDKSYSQGIINQLSGVGVEFHIDKSETEVSDVLSSCHYAFFDFPDGASERRGSLLACLEHAIICFANTGKQTSRSLSDVVFPNDFDVVCSTVLRLRNDVDEKIRVLNRTRKYTADYSWPTIAEKIESLCEK